MCTDWDIYQQILFHILSNAIKYSLNGQKVGIEFKFCAYQDNDFQHDEFSELPPLNILRNFIETKVTNIGPGFHSRKRRNFRTFAFEKPGEIQLNQNQGIGVGLSTADTLIRGMVGRMKILQERKEFDFVTEVRFTISTTNY